MGPEGSCGHFAAKRGLWWVVWGRTLAPAAFATRLAASKSAMVKTAKVVLPVGMVVSRRTCDERTTSELSRSVEAGAGDALGGWGSRERSRGKKGGVSREEGTRRRYRHLTARSDPQCRGPMRIPRLRRLRTPSSTILGLLTLAVVAVVCRSNQQRRGTNFFSQARGRVDATRRDATSRPAADGYRRYARRLPGAA